MHFRRSCRVSQELKCHRHWKNKLLHSWPISKQSIISQLFSCVDCSRIKFSYRNDQKWFGCERWNRSSSVDRSRRVAAHSLHTCSVACASIRTLLHTTIVYGETFALYSRVQVKQFNPKLNLFRWTENSLLCGCVLCIVRPTLSALAVRFVFTRGARANMISSKFAVSHSIHATLPAVDREDYATAIKLMRSVFNVCWTLLDSALFADRGYRFENSSFHPTQPISSFCNVVESIPGQLFWESFVWFCRRGPYAYCCYYCIFGSVLDVRFKNWQKQSPKTVVHLPLVTMSISCAHIVKHERTQRNKHQNCLKNHDKTRRRQPFVFLNMLHLRSSHRWIRHAALLVRQQSKCPDCDRFIDWIDAIPFCCWFVLSFKI